MNIKLSVIALLSAIMFFDGGAVISADTALPVDKLSDAHLDSSFVYTVTNDDCAEIMLYAGEEAEVTIPKSLEGHKVKSVLPYAVGNSYVTSVSIPPSVTDISDYAVGYSNYSGEEPKKNENLRIICHKDSAAEEYAQRYGFDFKAEPHSYSKTTAKAPDCTHDGEVVYRCGCGSSYTEKLDRLGHSYTVKVKTVSPTLKTEGYTLYRCSRCKATAKRKIKPKLVNIAKAEPSRLKKEYAYTGLTVKPVISLKYGGKTLKQGSDYTVSYAPQKNVGKSYITVSGKGVYGGSRKIGFKIVRASVKKAKPDKFKKIIKYNGKERDQSFCLYYNGNKLKLDSDYTVSYKNNVKVGTAQAVIRGRGNFTGTTVLNFKIRKIGWTKVNGNVYYYTKDGEAYRRGIYWIGKSAYMFSDSGVMQKGWQKISEGYCLFDRISGKRIIKKTVDGIKIDKNGFAVTDSKGKRKIETMMKAARILHKITKPTDTMAQKRLKCFKWVVAFPYKQYRKLGPIYRMQGWEVIFANDIFENHQGCCVSDSAAIAFLFREIGYNNVSICHDTGHAWTAIGKYIYDSVFAEAKSFKDNYNVIPKDYRIHPSAKRVIG